MSKEYPAHYTSDEVRRKARKRFRTLTTIMEIRATNQQDLDTRVILYLLSQCRVEFLRNPDVCPVMAVTLRNGRFVLLVNCEWLASDDASLGFFAMVICHEMYHLLKQDIPRFYRRIKLAGEDEEKRARAHRMFNIAVDAANNDQLRARHPILEVLKPGDMAPVLPENYDWERSAPASEYFETLAVLYSRIDEDVEKLVKDAKEAHAAWEEESNLPGGSDSKGADDEKKNDEDDEDGDKDEGEVDGKGGDEQGKGDCGDETDGKPEKGSGKEQGQPQKQPSDFLPPRPGDDAKNSKKIAWDMAKSELENHHPWQKPLGDDDLNDGAPQDVPDFTDEELESIAAEAEHASKTLVKKALRKAQKGIGRLPSHFQQTLMDLEHEAVIPWTEVMQNMIASQICVRRTITMQRFNRRRFMLHEIDEDGQMQALALPQPVFPGKRRDNEFLILFTIDTSGSMSNSDIAEGLVEMKKIKENNPFVRIIILQCDTHISHVHTLMAEDSVDDYIRDVGRTSGGGTHFREPFYLTRYLRTKQEEHRPQYRDPEEIRKLAMEYDDVDMIIYMTDGYGYAPSQDVAPGVPTLWLLPEYNGRPPTFEDQEFGQILHRKDYT